MRSQASGMPIVAVLSHSAIPNSAVKEFQVMKTFVNKLVLPLIAVAMLSFGVFHMLKAQQRLPKPPPPAPPARSPFASTIAGAGVIEARSENIAIGAALPGVVLEVYVPVEDVGQQVPAGAPLFRVDDRQ